MIGKFDHSLYINSMRIFILTITFLGLFCSSVYAQGNDEAMRAEFLEALPDVPRMDGMREMEDFILVFDKPEGRIIETLVHTENISVQEIKNYYAQTLPQLGWHKTESDEFVREEEKLSMHYEKDFVKITVSPNEE
ncbi:MAG: hypothetical protein ACLFR0_01380 [Alphaproteobacteria bacterium]